MNKLLLLDENRGVYIPMQFGIIYGDDVWNIDKELLKELHIDSPVYWEAWQEVLDNAKVQIEGLTYSLEQDGDLWAVPAGSTYTTINDHKHNRFMSTKEVQAYCFKNDIGKADVLLVTLKATYTFNWELLEYEQVIN